MAEKQILIVCGEASGDLNAANLAREIRKLDPSITIKAVGGDLLRHAGAQIIYDIKGLAVFGFFDVLKKLPQFFTLKDFLLKKIKEDKPDAIVFVDFSGFNLRLAKAINNAIRTIYYISPQVWASRSGRVKTIKRYISRMIVLFKFEEEFYKQHGIKVDFVGNALLDIVKPTADKLEFLRSYDLTHDKTTVALLPGSRKSEIKNIFPVMLRAAQRISKEMKSVQFVVAKSPHVDWNIYTNAVKGSNLHIEIIEGKTYDCLNVADFALVASGTATLETAIMQTPFAIVYKMNMLNYLLYRPQVKVPFIGMVNIVAGRKIVPEFIQFQATPAKIAEYALKILKDASARAQMKSGLAEVKSLLGEKGASRRAAQIIIDSLAQPS